MTDPTDVRRMEDAREERELQARLNKEQEDIDLIWLMSSRQGRRIVWRWLDKAGVFRLSFNTDALSMAFAEGNRNNGLQLLAQAMSLCPDQYTEMTKEANNDAHDRYGSGN